MKKPLSFLVYLSLLTAGVPVLLSGTPAAAQAVSATPSPVPTSTPTPTPTPVYPLGAGTPQPLPPTYIRVETLNRVGEVARWGAGSFLQPAMTADGKSLWLLTSLGVSQHSLPGLGQTRFVPLDRFKELKSILAFSADTLLAANQQDELVLVGVAGGEPLRKLTPPPQGAISRVIFSRDGRWLAGFIPAEYKLAIWEAASGEVRLFDSAGIFLDFFFSPDGKYLAILTPDGYELWDSATLKKAATPRLPPQTAYLAFSPDSSRLAAISADAEQTVQVIETFSGRTAVTLEGLPAGIYALAFSPGDSQLAVASPGRLQVFDLTQRKALFDQPQPGALLSWLAFSSSGQELLGLSGGHTLLSWKVSDASRIAAISDDAAEHAALAPDGSRLTIGVGASLKTYTLEGRLLHSFEGQNGPVRAFAYSPDGKFLASIASASDVYLWDVAGARLLGALQAHTRQPSALAFAPDSRLLASASTTELILWDLLAAKPRYTVPLQSAAYTLVACSPGGKMLVTVDAGGQGVLYEAASGREVVRFQAPRGVITLLFSPDGKLLAFAGQSGLGFWSLETRRTLMLDELAQTPLIGAAFSPNGTLLATTTNEGSVQMWDVALGKSLDTYIAAAPAAPTLAQWPVVWNAALGEGGITLRSANTVLTDVFFTPDSLRIVVGSKEGQVHVWAVLQ